MPNYKLYYFDGRGRAEATRLMFAYSKVPFEDVRIKHEDWPSFKPKTPFGSLPVLDVDGKMIPQSKALARFVAKQLKLVGKDDIENAYCDAYVDGIDDVLNSMLPFMREKDPEKKKAVWLELEETSIKPFFDQYEKFLTDNGTGYLVGNQLTWADLYLFDRVSSFCSMSPSFLDGHPNLTSLIETVNNTPNIKEWIEKRPKTEF